jgi:hypothetical protein
MIASVQLQKKSLLVSLKGLDPKTKCLAVNRQKYSNFDVGFDFDFDFWHQDELIGGKPPVVK